MRKISKRSDEERNPTNILIRTDCCRYCCSQIFEYWSSFQNIFPTSINYCSFVVKKIRSNMNLPWENMLRI